MGCRGAEREGNASWEKVISCSIRTSKLGTAGHAALQTYLQDQH